MPGIKDIASVWKNIKEIDLKPIRDSATHPVIIAIVGATGAGRHTLAEQMRTDPARPGTHTQTAILFPVLDKLIEVPAAHLIIVIVDGTRSDFSLEQTIVNKWNEAGKSVLVFINKIDLLENNLPLDTELGWHAGKVIYGSATDVSFLQRDFVPAVLELLPQQHLALGRQLPLFRVPISKQLINDTCFSNAAYSFSTGLAEIVPVLDIPLNVTDMIVLTKSQAFLAYKLGLLVGFSTSWQDYVTEFGSVIGGGFLWRQVARQLIGLIPAWGIIPKVAVAYSGTYVVGNAILSWYLTGKHLTPKQLRALSVQAFSRGKDVARRIGEKIPRPHLGKRREQKLLGPGTTAILDQGEPVPAPGDVVDKPGRTSEEVARIEYEPANSPVNIPTHGDVRSTRGRLFRRDVKKVSKSEKTRTCLECGKNSALDAEFCQYCGKKFEE